MSKKVILLGLGLLLLAGARAFADGFIVIPPQGGSRVVPLAVKYHRVRCEIKNGVAITHIDQVFYNPNTRQLEGIYLFPIPETATISRFSMFIDGKELKGEILDSEKARQTFEEIVRKMRDPALLEYAGRDLFRARVFPIPPLGEKRITLDYTEILNADEGILFYRYPLNTEKFSSKPLEEVAIDVEITSPVPIASVYSPSHRIEVTRKGEGKVLASFEERNVLPDKDFLLYYTLPQEGLGLSLLAHRSEGEEGYFLLLISPKPDFSEGEVLPKDVVFVLDTSGSMKGPKISQAKRALEFCLQGLGEQDRFNLITFATGVKKLSDGLLPTTKENLGKALDFIRQKEALGGTNIAEALKAALQSRNGDSERLFFVVFLTDGRPTVGEQDEIAILKMTSAHPGSNRRIFVFGVGHDVNTHLLDRLAAENRGLPVYVRPEEDIEVAVSNFYRKISRPVLSDLSIDFGKIEVSDLHPANLPDLFEGSQVILLGRYSGDGATGVVLKGQVAGGTGKKSFTYDADFPAREADNDFIPRLWANRKIAYLLNQMRLNGEQDELKEEIVRLAKKFGILTPYTSFLVMEDIQRRGGRDLLLERAWVNEARPVAPAEVKAGFKAAFGKGAFEAARKLSEERLASTVAGPSSDWGKVSGRQIIRYVGEKTFYLKDGVWIDSAFKPGRKVFRIRYLSSEYFDLLKKYPELGKFLAIGENVTLVFKGKIYEIRRN